MGKCVVCGKGNIFSLINSEGRCPDCEVKHRRELRNKNNSFEFTPDIFEEMPAPADSPISQPNKSSSPVLLFFTVFFCCILLFLAIYLYFSWNYDNDYAEPLRLSTTVTEDPALAQAISYLAFTSFSEEGLYEQLIFEGFSEDDARNAVKNCGADWKEQALLKALDYLDTSAFSDKSLTEQLVYEGFSAIEADYAVDNCGADWKEQAALKAAQYLEIHSFTREELIEQLKYEGFSSIEASYGVRANGL